MSSKNGLTSSLDWRTLSGLIQTFRGKYTEPFPELSPEFGRKFLWLSDCPTASLPHCLTAVHPWQFQDVGVAGRADCAGPTYPHSLMTGKNTRLPSKTLTSTWVRSVFISCGFLLLRTQVSCEPDSAPWSLSHHANY